MSFNQFLQQIGVEHGPGAMASDNLDSVRPDPVLTNASLGVKTPDLVAEKVFPVIPTDLDYFRVFDFGSDKAQVVETQRGYGAEANEVSISESSTALKILDQALVMKRDAAEINNSRTPLNVDIRNANALESIFRASIESKIATAAYTAANYTHSNTVTLSGNHLWSVAHADSDPRVDFATAREVVRNLIGVYPRTFVCDPYCWRKMQHNSVLISAYQYISGGKLTDEMLKDALEIDEVILTMPMYQSGSALAPLWTKTKSLLMYRPPAPAEETPMLGAIFAQNGTREMRTWLSPSGKIKYYQVTEAKAVKMLMDQCGYLFVDCVA